MRNKLIIIAFFIPSLIMILIFEIYYITNKSYHRHNVDYIFNELLNELNNEEYETIIIGDSLADNSFSRLIMHNTILNLATNQAITLAGNYYILKKYLSSNQKPKNVYLFMIPELLTSLPVGVHAYTYYQTVFNEKEQIKEIKEIDSTISFKNTNKVNFNINNYVESRKNKFFDINKYYPPIREPFVNIKKQDLKEAINFKSSNIDKRISNGNISFNQEIKDIPKIYLEKMLNLCKINDIKFTIIIEPLPKKLNLIFLESKLFSHIKSLDVNILNTNDYFEFKDEYFGDGVHIGGNVNQYYQNLIDETIIDIY